MTLKQAFQHSNYYSPVDCNLGLFVNLISIYNVAYNNKTDILILEAYNSANGIL